jgi:hypothetical protein
VFGRRLLSPHVHATVRGRAWPRSCQWPTLAGCWPSAAACSAPEPSRHLEWRCARPWSRPVGGAFVCGATLGRTLWQLARVAKARTSHVKAQPFLVPCVRHESRPTEGLGSCCCGSLSALCPVVFHPIADVALPLQMVFPERVGPFGHVCSSTWELASRPILPKLGCAPPASNWVNCSSSVKNASCSRSWG